MSVGYRLIKCTCLYPSFRSSHRKCSMKKLFFKISQYSQEKPLLESIFKKVAGLQTCNFTKKRLQHKFSCEYCEIIENTYFEKRLRIAASASLMPLLAILNQQFIIWSLIFYKTDMNNIAWISLIWYKQVK